MWTSYPRVLGMLECYAAAETAQPNETKTINNTIQRQISWNQKAEKATELARLETMFYYSELAYTIDHYEAEIDE